jgi:hypothetical protein
MGFFAIHEGGSLDATFRHGPDSPGFQSHTVETRLSQVNVQLVQKTLVFDRHFP